MGQQDQVGEVTHRGALGKSVQNVGGGAESFVCAYVRLRFGFLALVIEN